MFGRLAAGMMLLLLVEMGASAQTVRSVAVRDEPPLATRILDGAWPEDARALAIDSATLDQLGLHDDAHQLADAWQRREIAGLLGRAKPAPVSLRAAIAEEAAEHEPLERERLALASQGVSIDFTHPSSDESPDPRLADLGNSPPSPIIIRLQKGLWGAFDERVTRTSGHEPTDAYLLLVQVVVSNRTTVKLDMRINVALHGRESMDCLGKAVQPKTSANVFCSIHSWLDPQRSKSVEAAKSLIAGRLAPHIVGLRLDTGAPWPVLSIGPAAGPTDSILRSSSIVRAANKRITEAGYQQPRHVQRATSGRSLNAGIIWGVFTFAIMVLSVVYRFRSRTRPSAAWYVLLKIYAALLIMAVIVQTADSPSGPEPMSGALGFLAKIAVSLPWSYFALEGDTPIPEHSIFYIIFVLVNLAFLTAMAFGGSEHEHDEHSADDLGQPWR